LITGQPSLLGEVGMVGDHQHHQVDVAAQQVKLALFGLGANLFV
jgi:hypothetical protein